MNKQFKLPTRCHLFQSRHVKPHTASTAWLHIRAVRLLDWPACSPYLLQTENIWHIIKHKIQKRKPRTFDQLQSCIGQKWIDISVKGQTTGLLIVLVFYRLLLQKSVCYTVVKRALSQHLWDVLHHQILDEVIFVMKEKWLISNFNFGKHGILFWFTFYSVPIF